MKSASYLELFDEYPKLFDNENAPIKIIKDESDIEAWQEKRRKELAQQGLPSEWAEIGVVLEDPYIIILRDLVEFPNGYRNGYVRMISRPDLTGGVGVVMLPIYENGVVLLKHFRHSTRQWHFEIPRGYGEPNVSAENNARRELEEELGANISELISLGSYYPETGFESQCAEIFLARINSIGLLATDEGIVSFTLLGFIELEDWIANEKITDGFTIAAYTRAKLKGLI